MPRIDQIELAAAYHNLDFYKNAYLLGLHYEIVLGQAEEDRSLLTSVRGPLPTRVAAGRTGARSRSFPCHERDGDLPARRTPRQPPASPATHNWPSVSGAR